MVLETEEETKRLLLNRHVLINQAQGAKIEIESLPRDISSSIELFNDPENVAVIVIPESSMEVVAELPKGEELVAMMKNVI